ncbi:hypothetical protein L345_10481, partial [Ophiophagus hannah]
MGGLQLPEFPSWHANGGLFISFSGFYLPHGIDIWPLQPDLPRFFEEEGGVDFNSQNSRASFTLKGLLIALGSPSPPPPATSPHPTDPLGSHGWEERVAFLENFPMGHHRFPRNGASSRPTQTHPQTRVMSFIEKSVARLDQEDKLEILAFELGKNHFHYKAPPNYYEVRGRKESKPGLNSKVVLLNKEIAEEGITRE